MRDFLEKDAIRKLRFRPISGGERAHLHCRRSRSAEPIPRHNRTGPDNLRTAAADSAFLSSVLDYLVADEGLLVGFAADAGLKPEAVARAHAALSRRPEGEA